MVTENGGFDYWKWLEWLGVFSYGHLLLIYFNKQYNLISIAKLSIQIEISMTFFLPPVKRKQTVQSSARQRRDDSLAHSIPIDLQRDNKSSLDVLSCMLHEVEHELEEYERCTGREVQKAQRSEGLTGFTLSLVNALCRLMRYLKEVRRLWIPSVEWKKKDINLHQKRQLWSFLAPNQFTLKSNYHYITLQHSCIPNEHRTVLFRFLFRVYNHWKNYFKNLICFTVSCMDA